MNNFKFNGGTTFAEYKVEDIITVFYATEFFSNENLLHLQIFLDSDKGK